MSNANIPNNKIINPDTIILTFVDTSIPSFLRYFLILLLFCLWFILVSRGEKYKK